MKTNFTILLLLGLLMSATAAPGAPSEAPSFQLSTLNDQPTRPRVTPHPPLAPVPPNLRLILNSAEAIGDRLDAVHALGRNLSREEITALCLFLKSPPTPEAANLPALQLLKNDILNTLRDQAAPPEGLTELLIGIYRDRVQDSVIRDYAIQHLVSWYEQGPGDTTDAREKIRAVLEEAMRENTGIAGTALLGLHRLSVGDAAFDYKRISDFALNLVLSDDTQPATRITALQVCAERQIMKVLPASASLAQMPGNIPLQVSAIAALGRLGGPEHAALLRQMELEGNEPLRAAIRAALRRLNQKQELFYPNPNLT